MRYRKHLIHSILKLSGTFFFSKENPLSSLSKQLSVYHWKQPKLYLKPRSCMGDFIPHCKDIQNLLRLLEKSCLLGFFFSFMVQKITWFLDISLTAWADNRLSFSEEFRLILHIKVHKYYGNSLFPMRKVLVNFNYSFLIYFFTLYFFLM